MGLYEECSQFTRIECMSMWNGMASRVEVRIERHHLGDLADREIVRFRGPADRFGSGPIVDAEGLASSSLT
jgi:hypothetical protein